MKHNSLVHFDANRNKGRTNKRNSICLLYKCISYPYRYLFSTQMQNIATLQYRFNFLVKFELFRSGTVCTVCLDNPREVVLQGCGHVCVCGDCASRSGFPHYRNYLLYASAWWSFFFLVVDRAATKQFIHVCSSLCLSILKICQGNGSSTRRVCPALSRCFIFQDPVGGQPLPCLPARDW